MEEAKNFACDVCKLPDVPLDCLEIENDKVTCLSCKLEEFISKAVERIKGNVN